MALGVRKMMDLPITGTNAGSKNLVDVAIINSDGNHVDPAVAGGGAQYTEGDTDATITGTAMMWEDAADTLRVASAAKPFPVAIISGAGSGGTASADDADFTAGTTSGTPAMGVYESTPTNVTDGDMGVVGLTQKRHLKVTLFDTAGSELSVGGGTQYDEDTPATAAEKLTMAGVVRVDTPAGSLASADGDRTELTVDANNRLHAVIPLPSGAATSAKQDTGNTSLATIAAAVSTEMQCDIVGALPAGTNNIGDVDVLSLPALPAGNNNIGDVDIASIAAGDNNIGNVDIASIAAGDNNIGNVDVVTLPSIPAGTNNIGDVDVLSLPATPAGTNLIGKVSVGMDASAAYDGTTALTPKYAIIDNATSGDNTLIAAVTGKKIRVLAGMLLASAAVTVRFESGAGGTALTGQMTVEAKSGFPIPYCPVGHFETASNTLLNLELSGAVSVDGWLVYVEV